MENRIKSYIESWKTNFTYPVVIVAALILYYTGMSTLSPGKKLSEIKLEYKIKTDDSDNINERITRDSAYLDLIKEKGFLHAKIVMAGTDSVYMSVNLSDHTVSITISGVVVHSCKISQIRTSKILRTGDEYALAGLFSNPLNIVRDYSTIRKEPLMIKIAPRDTSEYKPDIIPDTSYIEPVCYILETDRGIRISVYQEEVAKLHDKMSLFRFDLNDRLRKAWRSFKRIVIFKVPVYQPYIKIKISKSDARILYRALPRNGQIAVYL